MMEDGTVFMLGGIWFACLSLALLLLLSVGAMVAQAVTIVLSLAIVSFMIGLAIGGIREDAHD